jgi:serine/threonine-protein kinase PknG
MRCGRDGCDGTIDDGFCDTCGLAPVGRSQIAAEPAGPASSRSVGTKGSARSTGSRATRASSRGHLGAGLVEIPPVEYRDPASVVVADPEVPESRRFCGHCERPVGRGRDGQAGRTEGFCPHCGGRYSFSPKLSAGELVAGQYEVCGCLAHGGMGWVYLARDRNVDGRWVVLKGLLDEGDESAMAAAIAERRFLSEVIHGNIVTIHNFVQHGSAGYIVMEYVGGQSLKDLRREPDGTPRPLPVAHAIAYTLEVLPALGYFHARNLLYCDFKPDNVIQTEEVVKLIDLGGVRRLDDEESDLYGTVGYQAPEVATDGPSVWSDLYTVARTLAVLVFDFKGFQDPKRYATSLPPPSTVAVFRQYPALYRFLQRGTHPDPAQRFSTAAEMAEQLLGVLRQVVAIDGGRPEPAPSRLFTPELGVDPDETNWRVLPFPAVDPTGPEAGVLASLAAASPAQVLAALEGLPPSPDGEFQKARAHLELGQDDQAAAVIAGQGAEYPDDWRGWWWQAVLQLADDRPKEAAEDFERVAAELPGELAPLLGMAMAAEAGGDPAGATPLYDLISATDPGVGNACFGLARCRLAEGDTPGAAAALRRVPATSSAHLAAQALLCSVLSHGDLDDLVAASTVLARLNGDDRRKGQLKRELLLAALEMVDAGTNGPTGVEVAGVPFEERPLRSALEQTCRSLAKLSPSDEERLRLVDEANFFRPRTLL